MKKRMLNGINNYIRRIEKCKEVYADVIDSMPKDNNKIYKITDKDMFEKVMVNFVTGLTQLTAQGDLMKIYDVAVHKDTLSLIIANKGATLYSLTEMSETPYILRHIGLCVYMPEIRGRICECWYCW